MAIPNEYTIEKLLDKTEKITVYQAYHPIHGTVAVYTPNDALPPETANSVRKTLYQCGIQMRNISQLNLPFVTRALEVSQNPNEPYIITEYVKYNLQNAINDRVTLKPKRVYRIFSQILRAIVSMVENGWQIDFLEPYQIKLDDIHQGNITFTAIGSGSLRTTGTRTIPISTGKLSSTITLKTEKDSAAIFPPTQTLKDSAIEKTLTLKNYFTEGQSRPGGIEPTVTLPQGDTTSEGEKELRLTQRNIHILGDIAYQLLFGKKYHRSDIATAVNINKLGSKWRTILERALRPGLDIRYNSYEAMLHDVNKVLTRNKRIAIGVAPLIVLGLIAGLYFGINKYIEYKETQKIMSSEAGQAVESFLNIIDKTNSDFPQLQEPSSSQDNDDAILKPFDKIAAPQKQN
jgi:serine/threonine protein kinase